MELDSSDNVQVFGTNEIAEVAEQWLRHLRSH